jgi:hypothetical protein
MSRSLSIAALALVFGLALNVQSPAQTPPPDEKPPVTQDQKQEEKKPEEPKKDPKVTAFENAIKDLPKVEGPFTFYQRKKDLLMELPEDKLGQIILLQATLATGLDSGLMHAGMPLGNMAVDAFRFELKEDQVWLIRPQIQRRWDPEDPFAVGAGRQFQEAILASFKVEQTNPEKKTLLVNVTNLFYGDLLRLSEMIMQGLGGPYALDREKSQVETVKGFEQNSVVQTRLHFFSPRGTQANPLMALLGLSTPNTLEDDRSAPLKVTFSMWYRQPDGYSPRVADPRVGYFTEDHFSVNRYLNVDRTERFINRFRLEKKDASAARSEPVKPIVFTIDPSIPPLYRDAVKEGVLRWNKAFDALGYQDAVRVQDVPADDKDYDHADGRYNVIRMMVSESSMFGAIALFRTDPFSGEILNASITLDGNMIRDLQEEHIRHMGIAQGGSKAAFEVLMRDQDRKTTEDFHVFATPEERARHELLHSMSSFGWARLACTNAMESTSHAVDAWFALQGAPYAINKEDYVKKFLADVVSHEVGHTLGLRHNFAGSTALSTAELANDELTSQSGISASVMDYTPPNVQAVLRGRGNFYSPTIGAYDKWAIRYGYTDLGIGTTVGERFQLSTIASESGKPGHAFMTDEDADNWNPFAVRFDNAKDPLNYGQQVLLAQRRARDYAVANMPRRGESYGKRTSVIMSTITRSFREGRNAARFVGGVEANRNFRGDAGERPTLRPVDAAVQRQAAKMIAENFFATDAFDLPADVLTSMSMDANMSSWNAPLRMVISQSQQNLLALMLSAGTTDRITENAFKVSGSYGLDEHYKIVTDAVFEEIGKDSNISPLRRDLQRFAINGFITIGGAANGMVNEDARMLSSHTLRSLNGRIKAQLAKPEKLDNMTRIHLREASENIERFLSRTVSASR